MTVASCPSCRERVTVPVDATPQCIVRCPLCHEEFKLEAFLAQLPPLLIVLSDDSPPTDAHQTGDQRSPDSGTHGSDSSSTVLESLDVTGKRAVAHDSVPAFDFTPESVDEEGGETAVAAPRRVARRQKNATWEVIKVVAGALLAVPAAQIILWWFVPGDWKRDLLGIGPSVSRVVPWMVPAKFRARGDEFADQQSFGLGTDGNNRALEQRPARPRTSNGSAMPRSGSGPLTNGRGKSSNAPLADERWTDQTSLNVPQTTGQTAADDARKWQRNAPAIPASDPAIPAAVPRGRPTQTEIVNGVRGAPEYRTADFRAALESALQISIAWDTNPDQTEQRRQQLTDEFYATFAHLGETVTYVIPGDPAARELVSDLHDVLRTFSRQPEKLAMIGNQTNQWLERADRPSQGIFLFGTVAQTRATGQVFATELELASLKKRAITIISRMDPSRFYEPSDRILMLGAIVRDPATNLVGYEGSESTVVMGGFPVLLDP